MTTVNQEEIQKFSKLADQWWDANGKFKPLHKFNPIRIKYIRDNVVKKFNLKIIVNYPNGVRYSHHTVSLQD